MEDLQPEIIVGDRDPARVSAWKEAFAGASFVSVVNISAFDLRTSGLLDADVLNSMMAHEQYGGAHVLGVSQVLSTKGEFASPPWVVTIPPFPIVGEAFYKVQDFKGVTRLHWPIKDGEDEVETEMVYLRYKTIFLSIRDFNRSSKSWIATIGVHTDLVTVRDINDFSSGFKSAYRDAFLNRTSDEALPA